jgi:hypothetical protein
MLHDYEAYEAFPEHRKWFNKLWLSEKLGYECGPGGVPVRKSGWYVDRPITNLSGMSIGAVKKYIHKSQIDTQPGYFWCEWFDGNQYSVTYEFEKNKWVSKCAYVADRDVENLYKFKSWNKIKHSPTLPNFFNSLFNVGQINVEFINENIIEVHLRNSPDPNYNELIPIWEGDEKKIDKFIELGYTWIQETENGDGFLKVKRLGFLVK